MNRRSNSMLVKHHQHRKLSSVDSTAIKVTEINHQNIVNENITNITNITNDGAKVQISETDANGLLLDEKGVLSMNKASPSQHGTVKIGESLQTDNNGELNSAFFHLHHDAEVTTNEKYIIAPSESFTEKILYPPSHHYSDNTPSNISISDLKSAINDFKELVGQTQTKYHSEGGDKTAYHIEYTNNNDHTRSVLLEEKNGSYQIVEVDVSTHSLGAPHKFYNAVFAKEGVFSSGSLYVGDVHLHLDGQGRLSLPRANATAPFSIGGETTNAFTDELKNKLENMGDNQLQKASNSQLGVVKVGSGLSVDGDGVLSNDYELPKASTTELGGMKVGGGLLVDGDGVVSNNYDLPKSSSSQLGGVKVGGGLMVDGDGVLDLPKASDSQLGGVKVGSGLSVDGDGVLELTKASDSQLGGVKVGSGLMVDGDGVLSNNYDLPKSSSSQLGGVKVGSGLSVDGDGVLELTKASDSQLGGVKVGSGLMVDGDGVLSNNYDLAKASDSQLGGVKVGSGLMVDGDGVLSNNYDLVKASDSQLGGVKVGSGLMVDSDGVLSNNYDLSKASESQLGGVKVGGGLSVDGGGVLELTKASDSQLGGVKVGSGLMVDGDGVLSNNYGLPKASDSQLGGVKVGGGLSVDGDGVLSNNYDLPKASGSQLGGVKVGSGLLVDGDGVLKANHGAGLGIDSNNNNELIVKLSDSDSNLEIKDTGLSLKNDVNLSGTLTADKVVTSGLDAVSLDIGSKFKFWDSNGVSPLLQIGHQALTETGANAFHSPTQIIMGLYNEFYPFMQIVSIEDTGGWIDFVSGSDVPSDHNGGRIRGQGAFLELAHQTEVLIVSPSLRVTASEVDFSNLPTSNPGVRGRLWQSDGYVRISP